MKRKNALKIYPAKIILQKNLIKVRKHLPKNKKQIYTFINEELRILFGQN